MCSKKWAKPGNSSGSCHDPALTVNAAYVNLVSGSLINKTFNLLGNSKYSYSFLSTVGFYISKCLCSD